MNTVIRATSYPLRIRNGRLESLLILKDNKLILEEYFYGYNRQELHNIHSCTKSIASLILGAMLNKHPSIEVSTPLSKGIRNQKVLIQSIRYSTSHCPHNQVVHFTKAMIVLFCLLESYTVSKVNKQMQSLIYRYSFHLE